MFFVVKYVSFLMNFTEFSLNYLNIFLEVFFFVLSKKLNFKNSYVFILLIDFRFAK